MNGLLLVDKPRGWTSFDVVAKVRGIVRAQGYKKAKVGHTGTLDPLATGLLIITLGSYCKRAQEYLKLDKTYQVKLQLGITSTTDDEEGEKTTSNQPIPSQDTIKQVILSFVGEIMQTPPIFSAVKIDGQRAYKLARRGETVNIEPRKVTVHSIEDIVITEDIVTFTAKVSSGTYIRSLVRDIGVKLGCGAYMTDLRRTQVGNLIIADAQQIETLNTENISVIQP